MTLTMRAAASLLATTPAAPTVRSGERGLPPEVRAAAEALLGADLSAVRIVEAPRAIRLRARAFTCGSRICFAPGAYDPDSPAGLHLLGHELAHVVQQHRGHVRNPHGYGVAVVRDPTLEAEADEVGRRLVVQLMEKKEEYAYRDELKGKDVNGAEALAYAELRSAGFEKSEIRVAESGGANADLIATNGAQAWFIEVKGQNNWMARANVLRDGNVPAKQLGNAVKSSRKLAVKGLVLGETEASVTTLGAYIRDSTDGFASLALGVTNLADADALMAFEMDYESDAIHDYFPITLTALWKLVDGVKAVEGQAWRLQDEWEGVVPLRAYMIQDPDYADALGAMLTEAMQTQALSNGPLELAKLDKDRIVRLVPVCRGVPKAKVVQNRRDWPEAPGGSVVLPMRKKKEKKGKKEATVWPYVRVTPEIYAHIFHGSYVNETLSGYHWEGTDGVGAPEAIAEGFGEPEEVPNCRRSVYHRDVRLRSNTKVVKKKGSTFFPRAWSIAQVCQAIETSVQEIKSKPYYTVKESYGAGMVLFYNGTSFFPYQWE